MKLWIARDESGGLFLYVNEPKRDYTRGVFQGTIGNGYRCADYIEISPQNFPSVTWANSPQVVEVGLHYEPERVNE